MTLNKSIPIKDSIRQMAQIMNFANLNLFYFQLCTLTKHFFWNTTQSEHLRNISYQISLALENMIFSGVRS